MRDLLPFVVTFLMAWLSADLLVPLVRRFAYAIGKVDKPGTRWVAIMTLGALPYIATSVHAHRDVLRWHLARSRTPTRKAATGSTRARTTTRY